MTSVEVDAGIWVFFMSPNPFSFPFCFPFCVGELYFSDFEDFYFENEGVKVHGTTTRVVCFSQDFGLLTVVYV